MTNEAFDHSFGDKRLDQRDKPDFKEMFYSQGTVEEALACSYCYNRLTGIVRLIPCGKFICGRCYDYFKSELEEESNTNIYKCKSCKREHQFPSEGFPVCTQLSDLLESNAEEKPLSQKAKELKILVIKVQAEMSQLNSFDPTDFLDIKEEILQTEVSEAAGASIEHINKTENKLRQQIMEHFQLCHASVKSKMSSECRVRKRVGESSQEIHTFNDKWIKFFEDAKLSVEETDVEAALVQNRTFLDNLKALKNDLENDATNQSSIIYSPNAQFLQNSDCLGQLFIGKIGKETIKSYLNA